jgi:hypothetical protein
MTIINDDSSVIIMWSSKLIDAARGVIYDHHMFIVYATGQNKHANLFQTKHIFPAKNY